MTHQPGRACTGIRCSRLCRRCWHQQPTEYREANRDKHKQHQAGKERSELFCNTYAIAGREAHKKRGCQKEADGQGMREARGCGSTLQQKGTITNSAPSA